MIDRLCRWAYSEVFDTNMWKSERKSLHVSFVVKKNAVLSCGTNHEDKTHPLAERFNYWGACIHSELAAILNVEMPQRPHAVRGGTMYNFRFHRNGNLALSKPCGKCVPMMMAFGIRDVVYWDDDFIMERL